MVSRRDLVFGLLLLGSVLGIFAASMHAARAERYRRDAESAWEQLAACESQRDRCLDVRLVHGGPNDGRRAILQCGTNEVLGVMP